MSQQGNIVLVGFMGTGKTSVGRELATQLDMTFVDMDDVIVQREGKSISKIFSQDGEDRFRQIERDIVQELSAQSGLVVAPGGGIVLNSENISDFSATGLVVCLTATPETILERVSGDANRPLLAEGDKKQKIKSILDSRIDLYNTIPNQIPTDGLTLEEVADRVADLYKKA